MAIITLKVSEEEKSFMQAMAKFEGRTLSESIRKSMIERYEDEYDAHVADASLMEYEEYLANGGERHTLAELMEELDIDVKENPDT